MEKRIRDSLDFIVRDLQLETKVRGIHVECRTLSCYTTIAANPADVAAVYEAVNPIMIGEVQQPGMSSDPDSSDPDLRDVTLFDLYRPDSRDERSYERFLEQATRPQVEYLKHMRAEARDAAPP